MTPDYDWQSLHRDALVIDSHNDTIVGLIRRDGQSMAGPDAPARPKPESLIGYLRGPVDTAEIPIQSDLPAMREGGLDAGYFAVDNTRAWGNHLAYVLDGFGWFHAELQAHSDQLALALTADDILAAKAAGKVAVVLAIENSEALERSLHVLPMLYRVGVRTMTITHSIRTFAGDGERAHHSGGGLTEFGQDLIAAMNDIGMLVDVSHLSVPAFWHAMQATSAPVIASHSSCRALNEHGRNLHDDQMKAIADGGGVIGVSCVHHFVHWTNPTLELYLDHVEHAVNIAGIDHVGFGSDFDGGSYLLDDARQVPQITQGLANRGWTEPNLRKFLGLNHLRAFRAACG